MYVTSHLKEQELGSVLLSQFCGQNEDQFSCCELTKGRNPLRQTANCQDKADLDLQASSVARQFHHVQAEIIGTMNIVTVK